MILSNNYWNLWANLQEAYLWYYKVTGCGSANQFLYHIVATYLKAKMWSKWSMVASWTHVRGVFHLEQYLLARTWDGKSLENMETLYNEADRQQKEYKCFFKRGHWRKAPESKARLMNSLNPCSINREEFVVAKQKLTNQGWFNDPYSIFMVEHLHLLHFDKSKKIETSTESYLSGTEKKIAILTTRQQIRKANLLKTTILPWCNNLLAAYDMDFSIHGVQFHFSST